MKTITSINDFQENNTFKIKLVSTDKSVSCTVIKDFEGCLSVEWSDYSENTPIDFFYSLIQNGDIKIS